MLSEPSNISSIWKNEGTLPLQHTEWGSLYLGDCMMLLPEIRSETIDTVFADPPFNLGKIYGKNTNDDIADVAYLDWCRLWISECVRTLKPGGSIWLYNLPRWNVLLGTYLTELGMDFRHWVAIEISSSFPIAGRLHPSHYSLLYYTKGKPSIFNNIRTPVQVCRHCGGDVKDYGGHRHAMNKGVNLKDVWTDIPPVRHKKFKSGDRSSNALSTKLLDRVIEISTIPGCIVLDPFGGSGTTFAVCEAKHRYWVGSEIDFGGVIMDRVRNHTVLPHKNEDIVTNS